MDTITIKGKRAGTSATITPSTTGKTFKVETFATYGKVKTGEKTLKSVKGCRSFAEKNGVIEK